MLLNETRQDSLDPRYDGPFEVLERKGPDVKLKVGKSFQEGNGGSHREFVNKWVHLDRCKEYHASSMIPIRIEL